MAKKDKVMLSIQLFVGIYRDSSMYVNGATLPLNIKVYATLENTCTLYISFYSVFWA